MGRSKSPTNTHNKKNNVSKKSKSLVNNKIKKSRKIKRMRKSSLSKAQKNFQVFNQNDDHVNKYENLELDASDSEVHHADSNRNKKSHISNDILVIDEEDDEDGYDDYDGHYDSPKPHQVIEITSEDENGDPSKQVPQLSGKPLENGLEANDDFIALSNSSDEQQQEKETEGEAEDEDVRENAATSDASENNISQISNRTSNTDYPWILNHDHSKQKEIADWLTMEIRDFVAYISPNREEIEIRNKTISKIRAALKELWSDADLHVFGSYATDLYLPGSDIDCVVNSRTGDKENRNSLYSLASFLKQKKLATQVEVIAKARVPIIKFVEPHSQIHIDVSFERINGLEAAKLIRGWLDETPGLRELVLIVKQFLHARRLNNVHTGGLGGFSIICLVFSFLQLHPRIVTDEIDPMDNLGVLLIDFFELYGKNFGYDDIGISVTDSHAAYIPKYEWRDLQPGRNPFALAIQDPGDCSNNISRGSFNLRDIKKSFAGAFDLLTNRCFELDVATFKDRVGKSILGNVIKYRGKPRDFNDERNLVINRAIVENENYHKKRSRIIHEEVFVDPSSDDALNEEEDMYRIEEPPMKKRVLVSKDKKVERKAIKKAEKRADKKDDKKAEKKSEKNSERKFEKKSEKNSEKKSEKNSENISKKESVDALMGITADEDEDEDGDGYNPLDAGKTNQNANTLDNTSNDTNGNEDDGAQMQKITVDAQTRRDYWLGKSNTMSGSNINNGKQ